MIRLFLDQGLPLRAEGLLRDQGWVVVHASSAGMASASDEEILSWCGEHGYIVVTQDHGFHQQVALLKARGPSVIRIRLQGLNHESVAALVGRIVRTHGVMLQDGAFVTVLGKRIRVRKLPLAGGESQ